MKGKLSKGERVLAAVFVIIGLLDTAVFCLALNQSIVRNRILDRGLTVTGVVLKKEIYYGDDGRDYETVYSFTPKGGNPATGRSKDIPYRVWKELLIGSSIEIAYDRTDPRQNCPVAAGKAGLFGFIVFYAAGAFFGLFTVAVAIAAISGTDPMRLVRREK